MQTLWKQQTPLHPTFVRLNRCLHEDWFLLAFELRLQRAHAAALRAAGILTAAEHAAVLSGIERLERTWTGADGPASEAEDLHTFVEAELTALAGEAGRKIHTARSRNDQVATLLRMFVIDAGAVLAGQWARLAGTAARRAKAWSGLVFPLQTHAQFAAPGSVGFWALRYATAFERMRRHVAYCVGQWKRECPLGSGAVAGSSIPIDRRIQARELGFEGPSPSALESTSTRDECVEFLALAAQAALHLQSLAADVIAFGQTPFGWIEYPREFATGSSMMPNKSNPDAMELLRGGAAGVAAAHGEAILLLKGLPSGYNRDLQCIKPLVRDAAGRLRELCEMAIAFLERLEFRADRLAAACRMAPIAATLEMEQQVRGGVPLRDAHHAVARAVEGGALAAEPPADVLDRYQTLGSTNPRETVRIADELLASLESS